MGIKLLFSRDSSRFLKVRVFKGTKLRRVVRFLKVRVFGGRVFPSFSW